MKRILELASLFLVTAMIAPANVSAGQAPGTGNNLNHTTPAPPAGTRNVTFQNDSTRPVVNTSAYVTYPTLQVVCPAGGDLSAPIATLIANLDQPDGAIIDARACSFATTWATAITISTPNITILLPCANLGATHPLTIAPGTRNVNIQGCGYRGTEASSRRLRGDSMECASQCLRVHRGRPYGRHANRRLPPLQYVDQHEPGQRIARRDRALRHAGHRHRKYLHAWNQRRGRCGPRAGRRTQLHRWPRVQRLHQWLRQRSRPGNDE